jgi:tetratricopeptide (TPR) repeat protein
MRLKHLVFLPLAALLALAGCSRDPNVVKRRYLESGNRYFAKEKYKYAAIMYKDAIQKDGLFGEAHYKLALTWMKMGQAGAAVQEFRKSIDTLPKNDTEYWDSVVKLSELYLAFSRDKQLLNEVDGYTKQLLARDPSSYDGHRLSGDLDLVHAQQEYSTANREQGKRDLDASLAEYQKANASKPDQTPVMMQIARVQSLEQNYPEAEKIYRWAIQKDKTNQFAYGELYKLYFFQQRMPEAEQVLKDAYQANPTKYGFLTALALHYSLMKRRDDMVRVLGEIKTHAKDYPQAYKTVGDFYLRLGDLDSAYHQYQEGLQKDPKQKVTYQKLMIEVLTREGKRAEAAQINQEVLKDNPNDPDAKSLEATLLLDKGDILNAMNELQGVVNRAPDNPVAHYELGRAHAARGEYEQARQQFERALELQPNNVRARIALAQLELVSQQYDAALKTAQEILTVDHNNAIATLIESASLVGEKKYPEARTLLETLIKSQPNSADAEFQLGVVNLAEQKYKDAEETFRKAYQLNPTNPRGLLGVVECNIAEKKPDAAIAVLQNESSQAPNRLDLKVALGNTALRLGKYDLALQAYNNALALVDKNSQQRGDVYLRLGETYRRKGDANSAITALQKARDAAPDNVVVLSTLAMVLDSNGHWAEAKKVYDASLKIRSDDPVALNNDAYLMAEHGGDLDQALSMAVKAKQLLPNLTEISDTLGVIYLKKQMSPQAVDVFQELVQKDPQSSTYHYHLGMAFAQKGDSPHAAQELQAALKYNPPPDERQQIQDLLARVGGK